MSPTRTSIRFADGIWVSNNGSNMLTIGGYPSAPETVALAITVTDSQNNIAGGTYTIAIGSTQVGFAVNGNVNYSGSQSGWVYLSLGTYGTAIPASALASGGAFTIRGVPPGSYTLNAWMDTLGTGSQNASSPTGSSNVTVKNAALSGASVRLNDPAAITLDSAPSLDNPQGYGTFSGGVFISYDPIFNNNGFEVPISYTLEYSTDSTFQTGVASKSFPATSGNRKGRLRAERRAQPLGRYRAHQ